jgi:uncharacterized membrane protein
MYKYCSGIAIPDHYLYYVHIYTSNFRIHRRTRKIRFTESLRTELKVMYLACVIFSFLPSGTNHVWRYSSKNKTFSLIACVPILCITCIFTLLISAYTEEQGKSTTPSVLFWCYQIEHLISSIRHLLSIQNRNHQ